MVCSNQPTGFWQSLRPALSPFGSNLLRSFAAARINRFCKEN